VGDDVPVDSETLLMTNFMNLKIKPAQSFGGTHKGRMCIHMFIGVGAHMCMRICICTVFLKKQFKRKDSSEAEYIMRVATANKECFLAPFKQAVT
jgi:hypothetical protein